MLIFINLVRKIRFALSQQIAQIVVFFFEFIVFYTVVCMLLLFLFVNRNTFFMVRKMGLHSLVFVIGGDGGKDLFNSLFARDFPRIIRQPSVNKRLFPNFIFYPIPAILKFSFLLVCCQFFGGFCHLFAPVI